MSRRISVLLVEDDDPLRDVLCELLRQWGCFVYPTGRGEQALELARRVTIDVSILDMHLPGTTGVEVYRSISQEIGQLPAILMSGEATAEEAQRALDLGMFDFLRKPIEAGRLRQCLDLLIQAHFGTHRPSRKPPSDPPRNP